MNSAAPPTRPGSWLREIARLKPAQWPWGIPVRSAIAVGAPLAAGLACNDIMTGMWIAMGARLQVTAERGGSYHTLFRTIAIAGCIGATGYFAGYLTALPWICVTAGMAVLGFVASIVSRFGAPCSMGAMQALLVAAIAIGLPATRPFWEPALLFLVGAAFYAALLGIEALLFRTRPERNVTVNLLHALAELAKSRADGIANAVPETRQAVNDRRAVTGQMSELYAIVLDRQYWSNARNADIDASARLLQRCGAIFAAILAQSDGRTLLTAAHWLDLAATAVAGRTCPSATAIVADEGYLSRAANALAVASPAPDAPFRPKAFSSKVDAALREENTSNQEQREFRRFNDMPKFSSASLDRLTPGRDAIQSALAFALCIGLAYATHWIDDDNHWFWIPLTVGLVMKPDLGSIFARAIQRCIGMAGGVLIGAAILTYIPKGMGLVLILSFLSGALPWAMRRSGALQAMVTAPLILLLMDIIAPGTANIDYAGQRFIDIIAGSSIVLVFGYFLWPRTHERALESAFNTALQTVADYLEAVALPPSGGAKRAEAARVSFLRRKAYGELTDIRSQLQKLMAEPPPAGSEATAWFPLIAATERICDRITAYSSHLNTSLSFRDAQTIRQLARFLRDMPVQPIPDALLVQASCDPASEFIGDIRTEIVTLSHLSASPYTRRSGDDSATPARQTL